MTLQKCSVCADECPSFLMMTDTICKICFLARDTRSAVEKVEKETKATIASLQLTVDLLSGKLVEYMMGNDKPLELDFSGFIDHGKENCKLEEEKAPEQRTPAEKCNDTRIAEVCTELKVLRDDTESWVAEGITEIRESESKSRERNENTQLYSYSNSSDMETRKKEEKELGLKNKYSLLEEETGDGETVNYTVVGSSIIKKFKGKSKRGKKRNIFCNPGAGMERIVEHIENGNIDGKTVVIHGGGNDIERMNTEDLIGLYKDAISKIRSNGKMGIVSGILPRHEKSPYWSSRAIGINNRVQNYCKKLDNVMFIDNWDRFYNNRRFYARDGVHLNNQGSELLSTIIDERVQINSNFVSRRQKRPAT